MHEVAVVAPLTPSEAKICATIDKHAGRSPPECAGGRSGPPKGEISAAPANSRMQGQIVFQLPEIMGWFAQWKIFVLNFSP
jgi:hypothetical protein